MVLNCSTQSGSTRPTCLPGEQPPEAGHGRARTPATRAAGWLGSLRRPIAALGLAAAASLGPLVGTASAQSLAARPTSALESFTNPGGYDARMASPYAIQPAGYHGGPILPGRQPVSHAAPTAGYASQPQYSGPVNALLHNRRSLFGPTACPQPAPDACPPQYNRYEEPTFGAPDRPALFPQGFLNGVRFRVDYLHYNFDDPGQQLVGAPQALGDPRDPFFVSTTGAGTDLVQVFDVGSFGLGDNSGVRGTLIVPTGQGDLEMSVWGFEQNGNTLVRGERLITGGLAETIVRPGISFSLNGALTNDQATVFDTLTIDLQTEVSGAKIDYALKAFSPETALFRVRPVIGFQYLRYREQFGARGPFIGSETIVDDLTTPFVDESGGILGATREFVIDRAIDARIDNNLFAPTLAMRFEAGNEWLTFTAEPKLALAANRRRQKIRQQNFLVFDEITDESPGTFSFDEFEETDLEPYFELTAAVEVRVSRRVSLHAGYNVLALTGIGRPTSAIEYDTFGTEGANINLRDQQDEVLLEGFFFGGEVLLGQVN